LSVDFNSNSQVICAASCDGASVM